MASLGANVFAVHAPITIGVLRNGPAADVARTSRESSIASKYYFRGVRHRAAFLGNAAARETSCPTAVILEAQIRCAFSTIVEADVDAARAAHAAGNGGNAAGFDEDAARAAAAGSAANRIEAIAVGAADTSLVQSFQVTTADLKDGEYGDPKLAVTPPGAAADQPAFFALLRMPTRGWTVTLASGHDQAGATAEELVILNMPPLTDDEAELAYALVTIGQVGPIRAGAQLFIDGHHYHSDPESSARHNAIEREVVGRLSTGARNLWRANVLTLRNAVWHASPHRVKGDLLQGWAEDIDMPERLDATGVGSFSVGLPAQEDLFNRAGSYTAVYNQVLQTATAHGHSLSITEMTETVTAMSMLSRRGGLPAVRPELPGQPAGPWPAGCNTRAKALKLFLEPALDKAEPVAAWMFGFYKEICSRAGIRANSQEGSLLRSYSLKRAIGNYLGEANRAQEMYSARARYIRTQAEDGNLETYSGSA